MKLLATAFILFFVTTILFYSCTSPADTRPVSATDTLTNKYGGYVSQAERGKHLVIIGGCGDCHTPKKMTAKGPVDDVALLLSGSQTPAPLPPATADQVAKGMAATLDQTAWIGPWGKSYAANITSDSTGIGSWTEAQFIKCLRNGKSKGLDNARTMMPPMPWQNYAQMTDGEIKAIFAYLKTTKPIHNVVPQYEPPVMAK